MSEPIKTGDICDVVAALGQHRTPNLGRRVTVISLQGEHSQHGRIWRCAGEGVQQLTDAGTYVTMGWADFAQSWLRKVPPEGTPPEHVTEKVADAA